MRALTGNVDLGITPGRLRGVSFLRSVFDAIGHAGGIAERLGAIAHGDKQRLYKDAFEALTGSFQIAGGLARTEDLRLVYEDYRLDLAGVYGLLDRTLDFRGKLTLFEAADRALAEGARGVKREIPIAAVKGTLDDPKVTISPQVALAFAAQIYGGSTERIGKLGKKIDEELGAEGGKQVIDLLDSVLGGGKKEKEEEQP
jgi:hypothetical protein